MEILDDWIKVEFDENVGYIKKSEITSVYKDNTIFDKSRIQKIKSKLDINMDLTQKSGLALSDYEKVLSNISSDKNKVFQNSYNDFYNIEQKYDINGIFLAAIAIHESGWGTSTIAKNKNNLFGYGAVDSNPYGGAYSFSSYNEGIDFFRKNSTS